MTFDPQGWVVTAKALDPPGGSPDEASLRSSFGRAYYAAFQTALVRLSDLGFAPVSGEKKHEWILQRLKAPKFGPIANDLRRLGGRLEKLKAGRVDADYHLNDSSPFFAGEAHRQAEKAHAWITEFLDLEDADLAACIRP